MLAADERARKAAEEKLVVLAELQRERGESQQYKADLAWGVKYLEERKNEFCVELAKFGKKVEDSVEAQEEKLRRLSIEYDEELYPHLMSTIAERRYLLYLNFFYVFCVSFLMPLLLFSQVVDQPWLALGGNGNFGVLRGCERLWEGSGVRCCSWQDAGH